ncbi:MAG: redox-sensitive bicupin YhaK (pirin superfamily) [Cognaticolwellia sp.]|jgi:redox-sensitive bicupin YhaK (pirin superfamily)
MNQHTDERAEKVIIKNTIRELSSISQGQLGSDGDGVKLTRLIGNQEVDMLDPFLLLDLFESNQASDYIGGFPDHPHRGFETVTYMLAGKMRHKDSAGNEGVISANGVQWMTAGKGVVHSEMPEQESGLLKGFQLWVNLPKTHKMIEPAYQEFPENELAMEYGDDGSEIRVISGTTNKGTTGPVINTHVKPTYMDVNLPAGTIFEQALPMKDNAFIFVIDGSVSVGNSDQQLRQNQLGILSKGDTVIVTSSSENSIFLLISGKPLNEKVARGGPFVMNTKAEVMQAFHDFQNNKF